MASRADYAAWKLNEEYRKQNPRTWQDFVADFNLTIEEQRELVSYLAHLRHEATIKALMPCLREPHSSSVTML
jgi:hypothetical protein